MAKVSSWVAIVDDDPSVLKALARLLRARAYEVKTYKSARDFLGTLPDGLPECLIADLHMPEMTGLELQLDLTRKGVYIPTIIITAHNESDARVRCELAGAVAFLSKPIQDTSLLTAIEDASRIAANHGHG
jgi:FixJ family two-component response regulator